MVCVVLATPHGGKPWAEHLLGSVPGARTYSVRLCSSVLIGPRLESNTRSLQYCAEQAAGSTGSTQQAEHRQQAAGSPRNITHLGRLHHLPVPTNALVPPEELALGSASHRASLRIADALPFQH
jgi:hypothetical protein